MNIFTDIQIPQNGESFEALYEKNGVLIERIVSSENLEEKVYKQPYDEWLVLLKGKAILLVEEEIIELYEGDTYLIEKEKEHQVKSTMRGTIWLCVHVKGEQDV